MASSRAFIGSTSRVVLLGIDPRINHKDTRTLKRVMIFDKVNRSWVSWTEEPFLRFAKRSLRFDVSTPCQNRGAVATGSKVPKAQAGSVTCSNPSIMTYSTTPAHKVLVQRSLSAS